MTIILPAVCIIFSLVTLDKIILLKSGNNYHRFQWWICILSVQTAQWWYFSIDIICISPTCCHAILHRLCKAGVLSLLSFRWVSGGSELWLRMEATFPGYKQFATGLVAVMWIQATFIGYHIEWKRVVFTKQLLERTMEVASLCSLCKAAFVTLPSYWPYNLYDQILL